MGDKKTKAQKDLSDTDEMRRKYKLLLNLGMVEMVTDLGLLEPTGQEPVNSPKTVGKKK